MLQSPDTRDKEGKYNDLPVTESFNDTPQLHLSLDIGLQCIATRRSGDALLAGVLADFLLSVQAHLHRQYILVVRYQSEHRAERSIL